MSLIWGVEAQTDMQKRLDDAELGFLKMDIVNPPCGAQAWGKYNDRPLNMTKVEEMRGLYHTMGVLSCQLDKVIYLPLRKSWFVDEVTPVIAGKYIHQVPALKFTPEGKQALADGEVHPLSGNHRRAALVLYVADLQAALKTLKAELEELEGNEEKTAKTEEIRIMSKRLEDAPYWAVKVYDIDKLSENDPQKLIFAYLSENETLPSTRAAEEDGLHVWFTKLIAAEDADAEADRARPDGDDETPPSTVNYDQVLQSALNWAHKAAENGKYLKILTCRFARLYFLTLSRMPAHFRDATDLKMSTISQRQKRDMGLAACIIDSSWDSFEDSITPSAGPGKDRRNLQRWDALALDDIDDAFVEHFGDFEKSAVRIGTHTTDYKNKLMLYSQSCVNAVKDVHKRRKEAGLPEDESFEDDVKSALNWPTGRADVIPLPFPTRAFIAWIFLFFESISKAVDEMVLTIDPIAFYDAQLSRTAKAQDITSSFLTAIEDDKHMLKHKKDIVAEQIAHMIFTSSAVVALQDELTHSEGFNLRPKDGIAVNKEFPFPWYEEAWKGKAPVTRASSSSKAKAKEEPTPLPRFKPGFFKDAQITEEEVAKRIKALKTILEGKTKSVKGSQAVIKRPSRESPEIAARACAVTTAHYPATTGNLCRDLAVFGRVGILEHFFVEKIAYRQALLPTALGAVRLKLHGILDPCVEEYVVDVAGGTPETVRTWRFIDHLTTPTTASANPVDHAELRARNAMEKQRKANIAYLKSLRAKIDSCPGAWSTAEEDEKNITRDLDYDVNHDLTAILESMWTNMERQLYRQFVGQDDAEYIIANQMDIPEEILTHRGATRDANTVLDNSKVGPSTKKKAPAKLEIAATVEKAPTQTKITTALPAKKRAPAASTSAGAETQPAASTSAGAVTQPAGDDNENTVSSSTPDWRGAPELIWNEAGKDLSWAQRLKKLTDANTAKARSKVESVKAMITAGGLVFPELSKPAKGFSKKVDFLEYFDRAIVHALTEADRDRRGDPDRPMPKRRRHNLAGKPEEQDLGVAILPRDNSHPVSNERTPHHSPPRSESPATVEQDIQEFDARDERPSQTPSAKSLSRKRSLGEKIDDKEAKKPRPNPEGQDNNGEESYDPTLEDRS